MISGDANLQIQNKERRPNRDTSLQIAMERAFKKIPPLWPLQNFVAVNPFLGFMGMKFQECARWLSSVNQDEILMPKRYFLEKYKNHHIAKEDLEKILSDLKNESVDLSSLMDASKTAFKKSETPEIYHAIQLEISKFLGSYFDEGQAIWSSPWRHYPLYKAWREFAKIDKTLEIKGIQGFRAWVTQLPSDPHQMIEEYLKVLEPKSEAWEIAIYRLMDLVGGWSSYLQYRMRENGTSNEKVGTCPENELRDLLAIRIAYEIAIPAQARIQMQILSSAPDHGDLSERLVWQNALEWNYQKNLLKKIAQHQTRRKSEKLKPEAPRFQTVFCIDVRSEVIRRQLEGLSKQTETFGFAGFFGFPFEFLRFGHSKQKHGSKQYPVLIQSKFRIREGLKSEELTGKGSPEDRLLTQKALRSTEQDLWTSFKSSAISCFSFVESLGGVFVWKLLKNSLGLGSKKDQVAQRFVPKIDLGHSCTGFSLGEKVQLAANALRNMGFSNTFAPLILLCGHKSETVNNPYASGLDCGACGGNSGGINARVAAFTLNDFQVRKELQTKGINIPEATWFIAGEHNTTTDEITLFDQDLLPATHQPMIRELQGLLREAGSKTRLERSERFFLKSAGKMQLVQKAVLRRSRDWSEVRPEWGLAGNAAMIVGDRSLTRGLNLDGRTFLHSYDPKQDSDGKILELIMTAPMVVANWINLQYYASAVNQSKYGSGNKVTHNIVGRFGIIQGNGSDLQPGLPMQSVHDGHKLIHEPLRLSVLIHAPLSRIDSIIRSNTTVSQLVNNGWLKLFALSADDEKFYEYHEQSWQLAQ